MSRQRRNFSAKFKSDLVIQCAVSLIFNITTASYSDAVVNVGYKEFNLYEDLKYYQSFCSNIVWS